MRRLTIGFALALSFHSPVCAGPPRLLADLATRSTGLDYAPAPPAGFAALRDQLLFSTIGDFGDSEAILWRRADDESRSQAIAAVEDSNRIGFAPVATTSDVAFLRGPDGTLWRSDGTDLGTFSLGFALPWPAPAAVVVDRETGEELVYVVTLEPSGKVQLRRSDGSPAETVAIGEPEFGFRDLLAWNGRLFWFGDEGLSVVERTGDAPRQLARVAWLSDSTTSLVATAAGVFFANGEHSGELWASDGTAAGTRRVAELPAIFGLQAAAGGVVIETGNDDWGRDLWWSDGTLAGTARIAVLPRDFRVSLGVSHLVQVGGRWLFLASTCDSGYELWSTTGDPATTARVAAGPRRIWDAFPATAESPAGLLILGEDRRHGTELWRTDGTVGGTFRLDDICPGPCSGLEGERPLPTSIAGKTYFVAASQVNASELWATDGTPAGTLRIAERPVKEVEALNGRAVFGQAGDAQSASQLWESDGTAAGTRALATVLDADAPGSWPAIWPARDGVLLAALDGELEALWRTDGTPEGTAKIPGSEASYATSQFSPDAKQAGKFTYFARYHDDPDPDRPWSTQLWRSTGTLESTTWIAQLPRESWVEFDLAADWNGRLLFIVDGRRGYEFWISDGTGAGTHPLATPTAGLRFPTGVAVLRDRFVFEARHDNQDGAVPQLFASDGTAAGTEQLTAEWQSRIYMDRPQFVALRGTLYGLMVAPDRVSSELWQTDGTPAGTRRVRLGLQNPSGLTVWNGALYLTAAADDAENPPRALFRWRGGGDEPERLAVVAPAACFCTPSTPPLVSGTPVGPWLLFAGEDEGGVEVWRTDGSPAGTGKLRELRAGPASSSPEGWVRAGDRAYFVARDDRHGRELWTSDGTPDGTRLVADLRPGLLSSQRGAPLVVVGNHLVFAADDGRLGDEPWTLDVGP